jgi:GT2 family glycosyltransferase
MRAAKVHGGSRPLQSFDHEEAMMSIRAASSATEDLTIVTVHFNTPAETIACVVSILDKYTVSTASFKYRIVVVDNRSETDRFLELKEGIDGLQSDAVILVRNCFNAGFGLGCMLGLNYSAGRYVAFVNSDTCFDEDCFTPLIAHLDRHSDIGVIGPRHRSIDGRPERSYGFDERLLDRLVGRRRKPMEPAEPIEVDYVFGAFMLFRRDALAVTGGFDPSIFLFYEEMDICQRLRKSGYRCVFHPGVSFRHIGQASVRALLDTKLESDLSLLYVMRKNGSYLRYRAFWLTKLVSYALRSLFNARYRKLLLRLLTAGAPQALSMRVGQACNFDFINRA